ncbi:MAG: transposase [Collinsella sp.]
MAGAARRVRRGRGTARSGAEGPQAEAAGRPRPPRLRPRRRSSRPRTEQVRFPAARYRGLSTRPGPSRAGDGGAARRATRPTRACSPCPASARGDARRSRGVGRHREVPLTTTTWPRTACIAPRVRSSGTSVRSVRASRRGDARLKSLLIFSCNSLVRSSGRYGEYYRACRARGMGHGRALKAVARKRPGDIRRMRDSGAYRE